MIPMEQCRQCGVVDKIPIVVPFFVIRPNGTTAHAWLHQGECLKAWMVKYRKWRRERS